MYLFTCTIYNNFKQINVARKTYYSTGKVLPFWFKKLKNKPFKNRMCCSYVFVSMYTLSAIIGQSAHMSLLDWPIGLLPLSQHCSDSLVCRHWTDQLVCHHWAAVGPTGLYPLDRPMDRQTKLCRTEGWCHWWTDGVIDVGPSDSNILSG